MNEGILDLDAVGQAEAVRSGEISPVELVEASIARIEERDPALNAVILPLFDEARELVAGDLPDGPFRGVPIALKDSALAAGHPFAIGVRPLRDAGTRCPFDDNVVSRLREAGAVCVGRTNVPELLNQGTTEPALRGPTRNPWDPERTAGGSSGGSAAAVAAGMVAAGHGNDGGGSIRIPASACGLVGLKPSRGRVSNAPMPDVAGNVGVEGMLCRSVRDAAAFLDVLAGSRPGDAHPMPPPHRPFADEVGADPGRLRICLMPQSLEGLTTDPECVAAVEEVGRVLEELGHAIVDDAPRLPTTERMLRGLQTSWSLSAVMLSSTLGQLLGRPIEPTELEPINQGLVEHAMTLTAVDKSRSDGWQASLTRSLGGWWASGRDLLVTPTLRTPPVKLGETVVHTGHPLDDWARQFTLFPMTACWNITGQPAVSLPTAMSVGGTPIGVQLIAAYGREDHLLQVAAQLEQAVPWGSRRPPVQLSA